MYYNSSETSCLVLNMTQVSDVAPGPLVLKVYLRVRSKPLINTYIRLLANLYVSKEFLEFKMHFNIEVFCPQPMHDNDTYHMDVFWLYV
jgi:hypothetical protein